MNTSFLLAIYVIIGSFILSFIIVPVSAIFNFKTALLIYGISWLILILGLMLGGKCAYNHCMTGVKNKFRRVRK